MADTNIENIETNGTNETVIESGENTAQQNDTLSYSELMERVAAAEARADRSEREKNKYKIAYDKTASELAEKKKSDRARMTSEEQAQSELLDLNKQLTDRVKELEEKDSLRTAMLAYKGKVEEEKIDLLIEAVNEKDHDSIANLISATYEKGKKDGYAEYLKSRPQINAGSGSSTMTMDEIMAIKDNSERQRAIAQNIHLFDR